MLAACRAGGRMAGEVGSRMGEWTGGMAMEQSILEEESLEEENGKADREEKGLEAARRAQTTRQRHTRSLFPT